MRRFPKAYFIGLIENTGNSIELAAEKKISTKIKKGVYENENHEGLDQGVYVKHSTFRWGRCASPGIFFFTYEPLFIRQRLVIYYAILLCLCCGGEASLSYFVFCFYWLCALLPCRSCTVTTFLHKVTTVRYPRRDDVSIFLVCSIN